jgi:hypothetical protein
MLCKKNNGSGRESNRFARKLNSEDHFEMYNRKALDRTLHFANAQISSLNSESWTQEAVSLNSDSFQTT